MKESEIKSFQNRWKAIEEVERRESRSATTLTRWKQLNAILRLAIGLGLSQKPDDDELIVYQRWATLKQQFEDT